jgi:predicted transcriptional regulator
MGERVARKRLRAMSVRLTEQREALTSPLRLELLEHLAVIGPASVRGLAARMGRTPHALHYHVRLMERAGLLRRTGTVKSGPRDEALYDVVADRYEIDRPSAAREGEAPEARTMRAVLRRAEREFMEALNSGRVGFHGSGCFGGRLRARLSAKARQDVARHLAAIQRIFADELRHDHPPRARPETCTFTAVYLEEPREGKRNH